MKYFSLFWLFLFLFPTYLFASGTCSENVCLYTSESFNNASLHIENKNPSPVTITIDCLTENASVTENVPIHFSMDGNSISDPVWLNPTIPTEPWKFNCWHYHKPGMLKATHDKDTLYRLPYAKKTKHVVAQSFGAITTHYRSAKYALDFLMAEGTPIHAARDGVVIMIKDKSDRTEKMRHKDVRNSNYILIEHSDKTIGAYYHLKKDKGNVSIMDKVQAGDLIGYSGNAGKSSEAYLHFEVYTPINGKTAMSLPILFQTKSGVIDHLKKGKVYEAV